MLKISLLRIGFFCCFLTAGQWTPYGSSLNSFLAQPSIVEKKAQIAEGIILELGDKNVTDMDIAEIWHSLKRVWVLAFGEEKLLSIFKKSEKSIVIDTRLVKVRIAKLVHPDLHNNSEESTKEILNRAQGLINDFIDALGKLQKENPARYQNIIDYAWEDVKNNSVGTEENLSLSQKRPAGRRLTREIDSPLMNVLEAAVNLYRQEKIEEATWKVIEVLEVIRDYPEIQVKSSDLQRAIEILEAYNRKTRGSLSRGNLDWRPGIDVLPFVDALEAFKHTEDNTQFRRAISLLRPVLVMRRDPHEMELIAGETSMDLKEVRQLSEEEYRKALQTANDNFNYIGLVLADHKGFRPIMKGFFLRGIETAQSQRGGMGTTDLELTWFAVDGLSSENREILKKGGLLLEERIFRSIPEEVFLNGHDFDEHLISRIGFSRRPDESAIDEVIAHWHEVLSLLKPQGYSLVPGEELTEDFVLGASSVVLTSSETSL